MFLLRTVVERLLGMVFGLVGTISLLQGLGVLCALLVSFAIPGRSGAAPWLKDALTRGALIGAILAAGGMLLVAIRSRSARRSASALDVDESLRREWVWPAAIPTLLFPVVAVALSGKLLTLCSEIVVALGRLGAPAEFARGGGVAGLILLPIFAVLLVPFLEVVAALSLIAIPPFLLALLIGRSHRFRMNCQRLMVTQATFVGASLAAADLFARLANRAAPHVHAAGGPEAAVVLESLARGSEVLMGTATGYAAVLAGYGVSLWVLMAVHVPQRVEWEAIAEPAPAPSESESEEVVPPVPELPRASRESFEEVLARYRARHGTVAGEAGPARRSGEYAPSPEGSGARTAASFAPPRLRNPVRTVLRVVLVGWGALLLGFGVWQLAMPHARYVSSSPAAGGSLPGPPAAIVVRFGQPLDLASSVSVHRTLGNVGEPEATDTPLVRAAALDPEDPTGRTLRAEPLPMLGGGIYRVDWRVRTAGRRDAGYGSFYFGIGMEVPGHLVGPAGGPFQQRDARARSHRATLIGGVLLLVLAALIPRRLPAAA